GPGLVQVLGELGVVLRSRALAGGVLEERAEPALERRDPGLEAGPVAVLLVGVPGGEELVCDREAAVSERFLFADAVAVGGEVPGQVRPAELAPGEVEVVVAPPAVGADDAG